MIRSALRNPRFLLAMLVLYWLAMVIGTHIPETAIPHVVDMQDKIVHAGAYALLTVLVLLLWRSAPSAIRPFSYVILALCMGVHAAADELTQHFVAGRAPDVLDWTADMLGVLVAVIFCESVSRWLGARPAFVAPATPVDATG